MKLKKYINKACLNKWAIGQFNFSTLDQLKAIVDASLKLKSPVILGTSKGEAGFFGMKEAVLLVSYYRKKFKHPLFLNLDHARDFKLAKEAVDLGYDMVHFDGSRLNIDDNILETEKIVKYAFKKQALVEAEIGEIPGQSSLSKKKIDFEINKTKLDEISVFNKKVKPHLLALSLGNIHGVYSQEPVIDFDLLKKANLIRDGFVLHGASGIKNSDIKKSIKMGIVKINVNTDLRIAWKNSLYLEPKEFSPYNILAQSQKAVFNKVCEKINLFGSQNKA